MRGSGARDLVLVGGGHAHALALAGFAARPPSGVRLTLVSEGPQAIYSGMLPGFVAGQYQAAELAIDAVALAQRAGAEVVLEKVCSIDAAGQRVVTASGREIAYDFASLDVGSGVLGSGLPGVASRPTPVETLPGGVRGESVPRRIQVRDITRVYNAPTYG